jgi:hypothetical protein
MDTGPELHLDISRTSNRYLYSSRVTSCRTEPVLIDASPSISPKPFRRVERSSRRSRPPRSLTEQRMCFGAYVHAALNAAHQHRRRHRGTGIAAAV